MTQAMLDAEKIKISQRELDIEAADKDVKAGQYSRAERNKLSLEAARIMQGKLPKQE